MEFITFCSSSSQMRVTIGLNGDRLRRALKDGLRKEESCQANLKCLSARKVTKIYVFDCTFVGAKLCIFRPKGALLCIAVARATLNDNEIEKRNNVHEKEKEKPR